MRHEFKTSPILTPRLDCDMRLLTPRSLRIPSTRGSGSESKLTSDCFQGSEVSVSQYILFSLSKNTYCKKKKKIRGIIFRICITIKKAAGRDDVALSTATISPRVRFGSIDQPQADIGWRNCAWNSSTTYHFTDIGKSIRSIFLCRRRYAYVQKFQPPCWPSWSYCCHSQEEIRVRFEVMPTHRIMYIQWFLYCSKYSYVICQTVLPALAIWIASSPVIAVIMRFIHQNIAPFRNGRRVRLNWWVLLDYIENIFWPNLFPIYASYTKCHIHILNRFINF